MGSAAQLNTFLAGVERRAYAIAMMSLKHREDALDVVQDAMMTLAQKYAAKPAGQWPPLFHRVLQNKITDCLRRRTGRGKLFAWFAEGDWAEVLDGVDPSQPEAPRQLELDAATQRLVEALEKLPARQRQAFVLRAWEGLDVRDTATAMRCSPGSVKTHYSRAVHVLREQLEEHVSV